MESLRNEYAACIDGISTFASYFYAGESTSTSARVAGLIKAERPALEILKVVVEGKRKVSGVSAELLR